MMAVIMSFNLRAVNGTSFNPTCDETMHNKTSLCNINVDLYMSNIKVLTVFLLN